MRDEPLNRYDIDFDTEEVMRQKEKFGDPMKMFKKQTDNLDINHKFGTRNFYLPSCKFTAPPNRFAIEPGYKWDGVDRSNGFEAKYLQSINLRKARESEYHLLRTEDM
jgi:pre-mRNA-splicing factor CWC26